MFETNWKRVWISPMRTFCSGPRTLVHPDEPDRICGVGENREKPWLDLTEFCSCTPIRCDLFYNHIISTHILHIIHIHICVFVSFAFAVFVSREDKPINQCNLACWADPFLLVRSWTLMKLGQAIGLAHDESLGRAEMVSCSCCSFVSANYQCSHGKDC